MGQGKRDPQMKYSEDASFWSTLILIIVVILIALFGCVPYNLDDVQEGKEHININGEDVEFVIDEYENPYLKYNINGKNLYIPFPFETEDEEEPYKGPMLTKLEKK